jgi:sugar-specific transcriptional regulator TrmB
VENFYLEKNPKKCYNYIEPKHIVMNIAQQVRSKNGNFRLAWEIMENHIEPEDLLLFTKEELEQVKNLADERLGQHIRELLWTRT